MSNINNRFVLVASKHGGSSIVPLISADDSVRGNGVLVSAGKRALPGATASTLLGAFMSRPGAHAVAKDHGLRLMVAGGSPAFVESRGMTDGTLYVYGGGAKRAILESKLGAIEGIVWRVEGKGGLYMTLPAGLTEGAASEVWDVLCGADFTSAGGGNGYVSDARLGADADSVALDAISPPVAAPKADKPAKGEKGSGKVGRPRKVEKQASAE